MWADRKIWVEPMGSEKPTSLKNVVAYTRNYLYDSRKASTRDRRKSGLAAARAIVLLALMGGVFWYVVWKVVAHFVAGR